MISPTARPPIGSRRSQKQAKRNHARPRYLALRQPAWPRNPQPTPKGNAIVEPSARSRLAALLAPRIQKFEPNAESPAASAARRLFAPRSPAPPVDHQILANALAAKGSR